MMAFPNPGSRHALEDAFFRNVDTMILGRFQNEADRDSAKQALATATGLSDSVLLRELVQLGITPPGLIALHLAPLVLVAWAQEGVSDSERKQIIRNSHQYGIHHGSMASLLLNHWLNHRPPATLYDAWKRFTLNELSQLGNRPRLKLVRLIEEQMITVAKSSGGHFGFGKISAAEQRLIDRVKSVLHDATVE
ncbi:MAG: hypothetical protein ACR2NZ_23735 [Rubripirellula sp.]